MLCEKVGLILKPSKKICFLFELAFYVKGEFFSKTCWWEWMYKSLGFMRRLDCWIVRMVLFLKYQITYSDNPRRIAFWQPITEKVRWRLARWRSNNLLMGGHLVLIKVVLSALQVYFLSFFKESYDRSHFYYWISL